MNDIDFKPEEVNRFRTEMRNIGRAICEVEAQIKADLSRVSAYWRDDSLETAKKNIAASDVQMRQALDQIDRNIGRALSRQMDWAQRYGRIR